jgi:hypothetical protein
LNSFSDSMAQRVACQHRVGWHVARSHRSDSKRRDQFLQAAWQLEHRPLSGPSAGD